MQTNEQPPRRALTHDQLWKVGTYLKQEELRYNQEQPQYDAVIAEVKRALDIQLTRNNLETVLKTVGSTWEPKHKYRRRGMGKHLPSGQRAVIHIARQLATICDQLGIQVSPQVNALANANVQDLENGKLEVPAPQPIQTNPVPATSATNPSKISIAPTTNGSK